MKKFRNLTLSLAIAGMSIASVSCGTTGTDLLNSLLTTGTSMAVGSMASNNSTKSQLITAGAQVLTQILTNRSAVQKGTSQTYNGTYTAQLLTFNKSAKNFQNSGSLVTKSATTTLVVNNASTGITMPAITAGNASMTQVTLTNLVATNGVFGLSDNSTVTEGKLTYGGTTYDLSNAYVELTYNQTSCSYSASIYFNYDETLQQYMLAMNVTFK